MKCDVINDVKLFPTDAQMFYFITQMFDFIQPDIVLQKQVHKNIGITHVFSCINICRVPRKLFEREADRPSVQHHPRDPASVNAMKQTCVIVILAYLPYSSPNRTENAAKTLNCPFLTLDFSKQNGVGCVLSNVITSS